MPEIFLVDGFDHYGVTGDVGASWTLTGGNWTPSSSYARPSLSAPEEAVKKGVVLTAVTAAAKRSLPGGAAGPVIAVGFDVKPPVAPAGDVTVLTLRTGGASGTVQLTLHRLADGSLTLCRGASTVLLSSGVDALTVDAWNRIDFEVTLDDSAGAAELWINDVSVDAASGTDTQEDASATVDHVTLHDIWGNKYALVAYLDNFYVAAARCPSLRVDTFLPDADGALADFAPSAGSDLYAMIDDEGPDGDTTYLSSETVGEQFSVTYPSQAVGDEVYGVQLEAVCVNPETGSIGVKHLMRAASSNYLCAAEHTVQTAYKTVTEVYATDPTDASPWTDAKVNAAEWGLEVTSKT